jgi:hypothetical protein
MTQQESVYKEKPRKDQFMDHDGIVKKNQMSIRFLKIIRFTYHTQKSHCTIEDIFEIHVLKK